MKLDHVAIATADHRPAVAAITGELGGLILSGGTPPNAGFRAMQIRLGRGESGMTVEVLEPHHPEHNDFLARFVAETGGGVHHMTFKTDDIAGELERLRALGVEPVGVDFRGGWKEMFIHPRDAHGTVVQIAQSSFEPPAMSEWLASLPHGMVTWDGDGRWWDPASVRPATTVATLRRVAVSTPDPSAGVAFYRDVLGGEVEGRTIRWEGGEIRLEEGSGRPRVSSLEMEGAQSGTIAGAVFMAVSAPS